MNFTEAKNNCEAMGYTLAVVETEAERDYLIEYMNATHYWVWLHKKTTEECDEEGKVLLLLNINI